MSGSLSFVTFCSNGHIVENVLEGTFNFETVKECKWCKSTKFHSVFSWHDREPQASLVPFEPVSYTWFLVNNENFRGEQRVPSYDVSRIKKWIDYSLPFYKELEEKRKSEDKKLEEVK